MSYKNEANLSVIGEKALFLHRKTPVQANCTTNKTTLSTRLQDIVTIWERLF